MSARHLWLALLALSLGALSGPVAAQEYPNKPIKFVVPYPPGGGTDVVARIVNEPLATALGQPIIIDNRGGAAGNLGTDIVAKAPADGYTILFTLSSHTINPKLYERLPFDVERDFIPVSLVALIPQILVVNPSVPITSIKELIAYAKANPGKLNYASVGIGSPAHVAGELFKQKTGIDMVHVPYKGGGPAITDTIGGQVQLAFVSLPAALQHVKSGRLRAIAVTSAKRSASAPDVPTIAEAGVPGYEAATWTGVIGPAGLSRPVLLKLNAAVNHAIESPAFLARFAKIGDEPAGGTPEDFAETIRRDSAKWAEVVKRSGAQID
jgi:tripartite-type tricarboxylate transporter receptor subunit TctC